jgi:hypothetical protein
MFCVIDKKLRLLSEIVKTGDGEGRFTLLTSIGAFVKEIRLFL